MNTKEKHIAENASNAVREARQRNDAPNADMVADSLRAEAKNRKRHSTFNINRLWIWLGVLVLIFILLYWLFAIGTMGDLMDWFNG